MKYIRNRGLLIIIFAYIFITIVLINENNIIYTNVVNPIFWGCILTYIMLYMKKCYIRFNKNRRYFIYMVVISCIHVILYFYVGFIFGFLKSPYNHSILAIIQNTIIQIIPVISIEVTRCVIATRNKDNKVILVLLTIILILVEISYNTLASLSSSKKELFEYICSNVLPFIAYSILYTYLTLKGSYSLTLTFRLFNKFVILLLPILPDINWFITGSTCILSATLIYVIFKYKFIKEKKDMRKTKDNLITKVSYLLTISISLLLILFMLGIFKYESIAIVSNSMSATFNRGDVVIFKKLNDKQLKEISKNSIIIYSIEEKNIAHRIIDIKHEGDTVTYRTKGDSNNVADKSFAQIEQIKGEYVFHIKYIGFPSVWLYEFLNN